MTDTPLAVVGLGLIGGSLVRAAAAAGRPVTGWSRGDGTRDAARADGYDVVDDLDDLLRAAAADDALVVLASPADTFEPLLRRIDEVAPQVRLTDVASIKGSVEDDVISLAPRARFIGSHPMAGTQHSGWSAGSAELFRDAAWVTTLVEDSDLDTWKVVAELALQLGCRVVPTEAAAHDDAVARISHLPHLLALALAQVGAGGGPLALSLAAGSFTDGTRVAATRPELIQAITQPNKRALVGAMDDALGILGVARGSLASTGSLIKITEAGHAGRVQFEQRGSTLAPVTLSGDDLFDQLVSVGASGGHVTAISGSGADLVVEALYPPVED